MRLSPASSQLLITLFCAMAGRLSAVQLPVVPAEDLVRVWRTENGLPEDTVRSVIQTPDGYLWIGTAHSGLARFNGMQFDSFTPANTPQIPETGVHRLLVDREGTMWVGLLSGAVVSQRDGQFVFERMGRRKPHDWLMQLLRDEREEKLFTTFGGGLLRRRAMQGKCQWEELEPPNASHLTQYAVDAGKAVLCATGDGKVFQLVGDEFVPLSPGATENVGKVFLLVADPHGQVWAGTDQGLAYWRNGTFEPVPGGDDPAKGQIKQLVPAADGGLWVRFESQLWKWQGDRWACQVESWGDRLEPRTALTFMAADPSGGVWCANLGSGVWHVGADGSLTPQSQSHEQLDYQVNALTLDQEGSVWLALEQGGLALLRQRFIESFQADTGGGPIYSLCEDERGTLWLGGAQHSLWRGEQDGFRRFPTPAEFRGAETVVAPGRGGGMWMSPILGGLWQRNTGDLERVLFPESFGHVARVIFQDRSDALWIGNEHGLWTWQGGHLKLFQSQDGFDPVDRHPTTERSGSQASRQEPPFVHAIAEGDDGSLWIGLMQGELRRFKDGVFTSYRPPWSKPWMCFWALLPDGEGGLWVGTLGAGLLHFKDGVFQRCTKNDGLPDDEVSQLLDDADGHLWLGTPKGIARISQSDLRDFFSGKISRVEALTYDQSDGLPTAQCSAGFQPACWRAIDGRLWFATSAGAVAINPKRVTINKRPPPVAIEEVRVDGKRMPGFAAIFTPNPDLPPLVVKPGTAHLEFHFAGLSLCAPEKVRYRWRLDGAQTDWVDGGDQRTASYSLLPPGRYTFRVQASNNDGVWNEEGSAVGFVVQPFFWQTAWFRFVVPLAAVGLLIGLGLMALRRRHQHQIERLRNQQAIQSERARIAQDLHDDLGASLTQISWLSTAASGNDLHSPATRKLLSEITFKSQQMVRGIDEIVWAVNPKNDVLSQTIAYVCQFAQDLLRSAQMRCRIDIQEPLPEHGLDSVTRHNLFLVLKEALHNAARHSHGKEVWLRVTAMPGGIRFLVEDDGIGLSPSIETNGDGITNMRHRAESLGANLSFTPRPGGGTRVTIEVPLK